MKLALSTVLAVSLVASVGATAVRANGYVHQQNLRIVQMAGVLANQSSWIASQASYYVGPGSNYYDFQALQELRSFAQFTNGLYLRASQLVSNHPWPAPGQGHGNGPGTPPGFGQPGGHSNHPGNQYDAIMIHRQLEQLFWHTWTQSTRVEAFLYRSVRLQSLRGFWDFQLGSTLRQLRRDLYGHGRDSRRSDNFARLFDN